MQSEWECGGKRGGAVTRFSAEWDVEGKIEILQKGCCAERVESL
jgi:hypothetical protein